MAARVRGRVRRRPLLLGVLVVAVLSGVLVFAQGARPTADPSVQVVSPAYAGTTYAFDGVVCVGSQVTGSSIAGVEVEQAPGGRTELVRAPDGPPTIGFPFDPHDSASLEGYELPAGEQDCRLRVLVTPDRLGRVEAGLLRIRLRYGPGGLLRHTASVRPDVALAVEGTGPDPRASQR